MAANSRRIASFSRDVPLISATRKAWPVRRYSVEYRGRLVNFVDPLRRSEMADSNSVQQITDSTFDQTVNAGKPVFVDFWAPWCGPCRIIGPIVEELAPSYQGKAVIGKVNVDDNPNIAQKFGVTSIPTLMMFKDGKIVDRAVGVMPKGELQRFIDKNL